MTTARNFSAKAGSSPLTAARCRRRLACSASLPGSRAGRPCCAFNLPTARVHRNRSANMCTIAASILSILSRRSHSVEMGSVISAITPSQVIVSPSCFISISVSYSFADPTIIQARSKTGQAVRARLHILVETEEVRRIVFGFEFDQSFVVASKGRADQILAFVPEEIQ